MMRWLVCSFLFHALALGLGWLVGSETRPHTQAVVFDIALVTFARESEPPERTPLPSPPEIPTLPKPKPATPRKTTPESRDDPGIGGKEKKGGPHLVVREDRFPYAYYLSTLRQRIQEGWHPPPLVSNQEAQERIAGVVFVIRRDGTVTDVHLEKPSGHFLYDQAAQRAIYGLGRLPPLPPEFPEEKLTIHVAFEAP